MINHFRTFNMTKEMSYDTVAYFINEDSHSDEVCYQEGDMQYKKLTLYKRRTATEKNIILMGGKGIQKDYEYRHLGGEVGRFLDEHNIKDVAFYQIPNQALPLFIEGLILGTTYQDSYKKNRKEQVLTNITFDNDVYIEKLYEEVFNKCKATLLARAISNAPLCRFNAQDYAAFVSESFKPLDVTVKILNKKDLIAKEFNGLLTVAKGSQIEPQVMVLTYQTNKDLPLTALVGKGITFDMGGYNIKTGKDLSGSRVDMGGSAAVFGAIYELATQKIEANVVGIMLCTENLINSEAMVPGDIITYRNGLTVQVKNTDAEGRLLLADGLLYAQELGATNIVDIATLTGSIGMALGKEMAGFFTDNEQMRRALNQSSDLTGEKLWELPLIKEYEKSLDSHYADLSNLSTMSFAGHITAALFLQKFVDESVHWAHIDIAAMTDVEHDQNDAVIGMTGYGVKLLAKLIEKIN